MLYGKYFQARKNRLVIYFIYRYKIAIKNRLVKICLYVIQYI